MAEKQKPQRPVVCIDPEIRELVPEFFENRKKDSKAILDNLKQGNFDDIRVIAHGMKGSGSIFGFKEISQTGESLEEAVKQRDGERIKELCARLSSYLEKVEVR